MPIWIVGPALWISDVRFSMPRESQGQVEGLAVSAQDYLTTYDLRLTTPSGNAKGVFGSAWQSARYGAVY